MNPLVLLLTAFVLAAPSASGQALVSPDEAVQAVRRFLAEPGLAASVRTLGIDYRLLDYRYVVQVSDGPYQGEYDVGARDGVVYVASFVRPQAPEPPAINAQEALAAAERFVRDHYPPLGRGVWQLSPQKDWQQGGDYVLDWRQVVNAYGVLAPWWINVVVDGATGEIRNYAVPPARIYGPTIPHVTRQQAERAAAAYTPYDPAAVPFEGVSLEMTEDSYGVQRLRWFLYQNRQPPDPENRTPIWCVVVDALSGEVAGTMAPLGGPRVAARPVRRVTGEPRYSVRLQGGRPLRCTVPPVVEKDTLWMRAEMLRGFGVYLRVAPEQLTIYAGNRGLSPRDVGAKFHDYGWWIPLRKTAQALGWRVDWVPRYREAVVHSKYTAMASPR